MDDLLKQDVPRQQVILEMKDISKSFSGVTVLHNVNLTLREGEIQGLVGENGAGKSTLMKILTGEYRMDSGSVMLFGKPVEIVDPRHAIDLGITMVYQELNNAPDMTIAENMFIGRELTKHGFADKKEMIRRTGEYLAALDLKFSPSERMRRLTVSEMQMVEIAKVVSYNSRIIVMDEPTSSITESEAEKLFAVLRKLKNMGISIVYISHKLEEMFALADSVTVLRDGYLVKNEKPEKLTKDDLIRLMVGREIDDIFPEKSGSFGEVIMEAEGLTARGQFENVSFSLRKGEILGFAGLVGAGRTETVMALFGHTRLDSGKVRIRGKEIPLKNPGVSVKNRIALIPEDRKLHGLNLIGKIADNTEMVVEYRNSRFGFVNMALKKQNALKMIKDLAVKCRGIDQYVLYLSGGNQQKVVLAKWLLSEPDIIIMDEPTRGIDVGAKIEIYKIINQLAAAGKAVIVISSELNEIIGLCNRVIVMYEGRVTGELEGKNIEQETIMAYAHAAAG
ncbi:MAG: sugar ABC transporter ATP-binding protein [Spirochaetaceae bacterium]|jgi:ABC-type sugar transport system ATPase subunit|nr:sugar ABC transporter ATP-binding protein [Spirochaetaceae bacterium]